MHAAVAAPFLTGAWRPSICLPVALESCAPMQAHHVLLHEHAHWRAHDWWRAQAVEAIACLFWFHPLVHLLRRRFRRDLELACDARVLAAGADARAYADTLWQLTQREPDRAGWAVPAMATTRSQLVDRIAGILSPPAGRAGRRRWPLVGLATAALLACAVDPAPRIVYRWIAPPPLAIAAPEEPPAPIAEQAAADDAAATRVVALPSTFRTAAADRAPRATERTRRTRAGGSEPPGAPPAPEAAPERAPAAPATASSLYRSLSEVAREERWPATPAAAPTGLELPPDDRFEQGLRRARAERERRNEQTLARVFALTGNVPLNPSVEIAPGALRLRVSGNEDGGE